MSTEIIKLVQVQPFSRYANTYQNIAKLSLSPRSTTKIKKFLQNSGWFNQSLFFEVRCKPYKLYGLKFLFQVALWLCCGNISPSDQSWFLLSISYIYYIIFHILIVLNIIDHFIMQDLKYSIHKRQFSNAFC